VDHSIVDSPLGALFEVPVFLRWNWFVKSGIDFDSLEKSVICSPPGSFTPLHLDAYGMQGWMYLICGKKVWELYPPHAVPVLFDPVFKEFYHAQKHAAERFPLLSCADRYVGTIEGGDLLFFPAGWPHQVTTVEASFGFGGSLINDFQIEEHMKWWLWERNLGLAGSLDLKTLILNLPPERFADAQGQARAQRALTLYNEWEGRMRALHAAG
jgi:hypothetical protein